MNCSNQITSTFKCHVSPLNRCLWWYIWHTTTTPTATPTGPKHIHILIVPSSGRVRIHVHDQRGHLDRGRDTALGRARRGAGFTRWCDGDTLGQLCGSSYGRGILPGGGGREKMMSVWRGSCGEGGRERKGERGRESESE